MTTKHNVLTPAECFSIRNEMVAGLCEVQKELDQQIEDEDVELSTLGLFLDVSLKLCNIPNRITMSRHLEATYDIANPMKQTCFLVYNHEKQLFYRTFVTGKTKLRHIPACVPVGRTLSFYLAVYLLLRFPDGFGKDTINYVFDSSIVTSKSIMKFVKEKLYNNGDLPPGVRVQHHLRHIMVNTVAVVSGFDRDTMKSFGMLSKHDLKTIESNYTVWKSVHKANGGVVGAAAHLDLVGVSEERQSSTMTNVARLYTEHYTGFNTNVAMGLGPMDGLTLRTEQEIFARYTKTEPRRLIVVYDPAKRFTDQTYVQNFNGVNVEGTPA